MSVLLIVLSSLGGLVGLYLLYFIVMLRLVTNRSLVFPGVEAGASRRNQELCYDEGKKLYCDIYTPVPGSQALPCVVLIPGEAPDFLIRRAKDWKLFRDYGRLLASRGFVAVTCGHRSSHKLKDPGIVEEDVRTLVKFIRTNAPTYGIDRDNILLWGFSGGVCAGFSWILREETPYIQGLVSYYGLLGHTDPEFDLPGLISRKQGALPPLFFVNAALDRSRLVGEAYKRFCEAVQSGPLSLTCLEHPNGRHGFDTLDNNAGSREIITKTLAFLESRKVRNR